MRTRTATVVVLALIASFGVAPAGDQRAVAASSPTYKRSNPGQLNVVTVNARQEHVLDKESFEMLHELTRALRRRPAAFDGGSSRAVAVPDVILLQEMRFSNLEIFKRMMKRHYPFPYEVAGDGEATTKVLVNLGTLTPTGEGGTWNDVCLGGKQQGGRTYQWLVLTENATGARVVVAAVHFSQRYGARGQQDCLFRNIDFMRTQLDVLPGVVVVGGDFNKRAMTELRECDPYERSQSLPWYVRMVGHDISGTIAYDDAVRTVRRRVAGSLGTEWTFERAVEIETCGGAQNFKRSRIDYLFSRGAVVADAGADHPGWAGDDAGTKHPTNYKYSDHRFVSARLVLATLARPKRPHAVPGVAGLVQLTWEPVPNATGYAILRSRGRTPYERLATVGTKTTSYRDVNTEHSGSYRYSVAALGPSGQGWESRAIWATADARGPTVVEASPAPGADGVGIRTRIKVRFDERVKGTSVDKDSIRLTRFGRRIPGEVRRVAPRVLRFVPARALRKGTTYRVAVGGTTDLLGNVALTSAWRFRTVAPPKRKKRRF